MGVQRKELAMAHFTNDALLAKYFELMTDDASSDAELGVIVTELERRGL